MYSLPESVADARPKMALVKPQFASDFDPFAALWISRLCIGYSAAMRELSDGLSSEEMRQMIGLTPREGRLKRPEVRPLLKQRAEELAQQLPGRKAVFMRNIAMLGQLLKLNKLEEDILTFAALGQHHPFLVEVLEDIRVSSIDSLLKLLVIALKAREADIRKALRNNGPLLTTRIICVEGVETRRSLRVVLPPNLCAALFSDADDIQDLMSAFLEKAPRPSLRADAFTHLARETALLSAYLSKAGSVGAVGVNILIYGPPGTGKTEYVRWLASELGKQLYQVKATDNQGDAISGQDRLAFYQLSQSFLQNTEALVLFDEIEDVFPNHDSVFELMLPSSKPAAGKMFINRVLESNPVPAIWVSNEVSHIDNAYLRRFDFSFEMGVPPIGVRRGILRKYLRGHRISEEVISQLAQQDQLTPAQIEKAAKVLKLSGSTPDQRESTLLLVIENSQQLLEQPKNEAYLNLATCRYELDFLNADIDLAELVAQLKRAPKSTGAFCFYGAPGTGKTALAHYLAHEIELPLLARRASDILGPYVGETEQKIAAMFKQARQEGALLLLDEADSFLNERQSARNSWEVSAVNEMLTQMERFDGLFICSTNLMQRLDAASLRRFALKIRFDYLRPEQRWRLFREHVPKAAKWPEADCRAALDRLSNLTPGDFATVRRQAALFNLTLTPEELLNRLQQECRSKTDRTGKQPIGFIHAP